MYSGSWSPSLRQGDILGPLPFLALKADVTLVTSGLVTGAGVGAEVNALVVPVTSRYVAVLSHDCEFNVGKRSSFIVARLIAVRPDLTEEQLAELRAANDIVASAEDGGAYGALDTFVVDPVPEAFESLMQIDLVNVMSCPMKAAPEYLRSKRAEMLHEHRVMFRRKIALFFGREAEDVSEQEKRPPSEFLGD